ncbi:keratin, type I cytoskeletal 17-like [Stigmatopora argus]
MARTDLEMQVEGLKEELSHLKKNHAEEMAALRSQLDAGPGVTRQYKPVPEKNSRDMDNWDKSKFDELNMQVASSMQTLQTSRMEISELQKTLQALQNELQSQVSLRAAVESQLAKTESRYEAIVNGLENELGQMRSDIKKQASEYKKLQENMTRLEKEIAEYRTLLDGEDKKPWILPFCLLAGPCKNLKEVKVQPVRTQLVEEMVNGKVVSRTEDVDVDVLKN